MGWKNVKEHYRIAHIVQVTTKGLCVGSSYIHDILVVDDDGNLLKRYEGLSEDLNRYQREFETDPETLKRLINTPDTFSSSIPVYTYDNADIIEKRCEEPGWPNVTHDGMLMYENTFSTDRNQVISWARRGAKSSIQFFKENIEELESRLVDLRAQLAKEKGILAKLEADHPVMDSMEIRTRGRKVGAAG